MESYYWRQELRADLRWLHEHRMYKRWSEKQQALFERRLILVAFQIRTLIARKRVNSTVSGRKVDCTWHPKIGTGPVTRLNAHRLDRHFAIADPRPAELNAWDLANQLIHHYEMITITEPKRFLEVFVYSDRSRDKGLFLVTIDSMLELFDLFGSEQSSVSTSSVIWNPAKRDYDIHV